MSEVLLFCDFYLVRPSAAEFAMIKQEIKDKLITGTTTHKPFNIQRSAEKKSGVTVLKNKRMNSKIKGVTHLETRTMSIN
jgi:hypothetical protein